MSAKSKPQEVLSLADLGVEAGAMTVVLDLNPPPLRGDSRKVDDDGTAAEQLVAFLQERKLL
jgi:electron transfer flavoprotein alpha/beta subunit